MDPEMYNALSWGGDIWISAIQMTEDARLGNGRFHSMTVMGTGCRKIAVNYLTGAWKVLTRLNGWNSSQGLFPLRGNWGQGTISVNIVKILLYR